jgi:predicted permease
MPDLLQDLRFGLRLLVRDRSFSITALLTLAVCIAANTAMFSVVRSVLLKPLPFSGSESVVLLYNSYPNAGAPRVGNAVPDYFDRLTAVPALQDLSVFVRDGLTYGDDRGAERLIGIRATPSFFRLVQARPVAGRIFTDDEGEPGKNQKAILTYALWQRKFAGDPSVIGRSVRLNGTPHDVVGVLPREFTFLEKDIDLFVPAAFRPEDKSDERRHNNNWQMIGRLAPGASLERVREQVEALNAANDKRFPEFHQILADARFHTVTVMLQDDVVRDVRGALYLLWGGVLFVLLIGCVNIANLVIVRASGRAREMATRHAIGGDLRRLARQLLTETTVLSLAAGFAGVLTGWWLLRWMASLALADFPRAYEIHLDAAVVLLMLALTVAVGVALGVAPTVQLWRMNLNAELREESRGGTSGRRANLIRSVLATAQVAIALVLLVGAGLLLASFRAILNLDYGFRADDVMTAKVTLPGVSYKDPAAMVAFEQRALQAIRALPSVEAAGGTTAVPFSGDLNNSVVLAEGYVMQPGESLLAPSRLTVTSGYFETMRMSLVRGRFFDARDTANAARVAVIDDRLARKFWPNQDPIGRRLYFPEDPKDLKKITPKTEFLNVVGVVKEVQMIDPRADYTPVGAYIFPYEQNPTRMLTFAIRTRAGAANVMSDVRREIAKLDPQLPVYRVQPMQQWIDDALVGRRVPMLIATAFGAVALFLSAIGIYGVLAYSVTQRRRELGVRMALGGTSASVFGLVLRDGLKIVSIGLAAGLAGSIALGQVMKSQLFEVAPMSPLVLVLVTLMLLVVAVLAVSVPALRASRINPVVVLGK